jgi:ATP adenylyltransferase
VSKKPGGTTLLWAPWRIPYLRKITRQTKPGGCFFCDYAAAPKKDRKNLVVLRGKTCFVVMNRFPYAGGHLLVAPLAHQGELAKLSRAEREEIFDLLVRMEQTLDRLMHPQGFNIGLNIGRAAGAGVPGHLHFHLVPRWNGDHNFMTTVAQVKVIPQALEELHGELQKALRTVR